MTKEIKNPETIALHGGECGIHTRPLKRQKNKNDSIPTSSPSL